MGRGISCRTDLFVVQILRLHIIDMPFGESAGYGKDMVMNMTRREACYFLGIRENASDEQIKRAYRYKAKLYHPDANPSGDTKEYYIKLQKAYEYLMNNPYVPNNTDNTVWGNMEAAPRQQTVPNGAYFYQAPPPPQRPVKIFATSAATRDSYKKQKEMASEHERIEKWNKDYKNSKRRQQQMQQYDLPKRSKEEEIIEKIKTIWIAENIKRQIEHDREQKEMLQRRKLYKAFMQQKMQDKDQ